MENDTRPHVMDKVEARQGDRKKLNYNVLVWSVALVIIGFIVAYFLA
ncbi:MAG: hypothetical protein K2X11_17280 [Acetobacteraceae bacterium]|nr:hypothetical protein [Acetobacteraceae bacterium]